jgi:hypothetical protein
MFNKTSLKLLIPWVWVMFPKSWKKNPEHFDIIMFIKFVNQEIVEMVQFIAAGDGMIILDYLQALMPLFYKFDGLAH